MKSRTNTGKSLWQRLTSDILDITSNKKIAGAAYLAAAKGLGAPPAARLEV
jgi:hypothetical protein